jgi:hypothetical protein
MSNVVFTLFQIRNKWREMRGRVGRAIRAKFRSMLPVWRTTLKYRNGHWNVWVTRERAGLFAQMLRPCHVVVQNHGPAPVRLVAQDGDLMDLPPGCLRATYVRGTLIVEVRGEDPALIELEFLPLLSRR